MPSESSQTAYDVRCEWGREGVLALAPASDVIVIVDVLSFSTSVEIATARGAVIHPFRWRDESAVAFARSVGAELAGQNDRGWSLEPSTLESIDSGVGLVLPSPNGSELTTLTGTTPTLAGCVRNASAVAEAASRRGDRITVIAAGERWPDGSLRPCFKDLCGAGAILRHLPGSLSPEARAAVAVYRDAEGSLFESIRSCESGQEKESRGLLRDVELASELDVSDCVPCLIEGVYQRE